MTATATTTTTPAGRLRAATLATTPGRFRVWSLLAVGALAVATVTGAASAAQMRASTRRANANSGPVLVAVQQLVASVAEADAAATAAFLSGKDEDPEQRRLYEAAMTRATDQVDDIASLAGGDKTIHEILGRVSVQLTRYAGLVEAARASNKSGSADANGYITGAVRQATSLVNGDVKTLTRQAQSSLHHDESRRTRGEGAAIAALLVALGLLGLGSLELVQRSRRLVNPPVAAALIMTVIAVVWLVRAGTTSGDDLGQARQQGYNSIVTTTDLAGAGFESKANEMLAVITGDPAIRSEADRLASAVAFAPIDQSAAVALRLNASGAWPHGLLAQAAGAADSPRERAAVAEAGLRWQRYKDTVARLRAAPTPAAAKAIAVGQANADFNGFNFSVEAILGQNRDQFLHGLTSASHGTSRVPTALLLLLVGAAAMALWGFQIRINDYR